MVRAGRFHRPAPRRFPLRVPRFGWRLCWRRDATSKAGRKTMLLAGIASPAALFTQIAALLWNASSRLEFPCSAGKPSPSPGGPERRRTPWRYTAKQAAPVPERDSEERYMKQKSSAPLKIAKPIWTRAMRRTAKAASADSVSEMERMFLAELRTRRERLKQWLQIIKWEYPQKIETGSAPRERLKQRRAQVN
jgi:hypothetical protein